MNRPSPPAPPSFPDPAPPPAGTPGPPWLVNLLVTLRCPRKCEFCDIPEHRTEELPTPFWRDVLDQLADWLPAGRPVIFAGGEPMMRPDLLDLARHARSRGLAVGIATNGFFLDGDRLARMADMDLDLTVSIDGFRRNHDRFRNAPGLFVRIVNALDEMEAFPGVRVHTATLIHGRNLDEVVPLARQLLERPVVKSLYFQVIVQNLAADPDPEWRAASPLWPRDPDRAESVLRELIALKEAGSRIEQTPDHFRSWIAYFRNPESLTNDADCHVPDSSITINPSGRVTLCGTLGPVGDARETPLKSLWEGEAAARTRERARNCRIVCNQLINCGRPDRVLTLAPPRRSPCPDARGQRPKIA